MAAHRGDTPAGRNDAGFDSAESVSFNDPVRGHRTPQLQGRTLVSFGGQAT